MRQIGRRLGLPGRPDMDDRVRLDKCLAMFQERNQRNTPVSIMAGAATREHARRHGR